MPSLWLIQVQSLVPHMVLQAYPRVICETEPRVSPENCWIYSPTTVSPQPYRYRKTGDVKLYHDELLFMYLLPGQELLSVYSEAFLMWNSNSIKAVTCSTKVFINRITYFSVLNLMEYQVCFNFTHLLILSSPFLLLFFPL